MLFNAIVFAVFLPIVSTIYWLIPSNNIRVLNSVAFRTYLNNTFVVVAVNTGR